MRTFSLGSFGEVALEEDSVKRWALPSSEEMRRLDAETISSGEFSSIDLMERAGRAVADEVSAMLVDDSGGIVVLCGPGNNGGDGLVAARLLHAAGKRVVAIVAWAERYSEDFVTQVKLCPVVKAVAPFSPALQGIGVPFVEINKGDIGALIGEASVVVDALLGTGQREAPAAGIRELVEKLYEAQVSRGASLPVLAVDLPTGINCDTGAVFECKVTASKTVALELIKRGCLQFPARAHCGEIVVHPIGISRREGIEFRCAEGSVLPRFAPRLADVHKGLLPQVLIIGGSRSMPGAPVLASMGALYCGAGRVTRAFRGSWGAEGSIPEAISCVLEGNEESFVLNDVEHLRQALVAADVVVVGPGLGTSASVVEFLGGLLELVRSVAGAGDAPSVVFDADALSVIAKEGLSLAGVAAILTPHPGEAARLCGITPERVQADRFACARGLSERYGAVTVLKGAGTIVHDGHQGAVIARGTPYLATPGSGDVLAGIVSSCIPRVKSLFDAAVCGAYLHARAGEEASRSSGGVILASDLARSVARIVAEYE